MVPAAALSHLDTTAKIKFTTQSIHIGQKWADMLGFCYTQLYDSRKAAIEG